LTLRFLGRHHDLVIRVVAMGVLLAVPLPVSADAPAPLVLVVESHRAGVDIPGLRRTLEVALARPVVGPLEASDHPSLTVCVEIAADGSSTVLVLGSRAMRRAFAAPQPANALQAALASSIAAMVGQYMQEEPLATGLLDWDSRPIYALVESPLLPWPEDESTPPASYAPRGARESAFGLSAPPPAVQNR
jgi:hypothetical protein